MEDYRDTLRDAARWHLSVAGESFREVLPSATQAESVRSLILMLLNAVPSIAIVFAAGIALLGHPAAAWWVAGSAGASVWLRTLYRRWLLAHSELREIKADQAKYRSTAEALKQRVRFLRELAPLAVPGREDRALELIMRRLEMEQQQVIKILEKAKERGALSAALTSAMATDSPGGKWFGVAAWFATIYPGEIVSPYGLFDSHTEHDDGTVSFMITPDNVNACRDHAINLCELIIRELESVDSTANHDELIVAGDRAIPGYMGTVIKEHTRQRGI